MAGNDGTLNFDTKIDSSGFQKGLDGIGGAAQKGLSVTSKMLGGAATVVTALGGAAIKVGSDFEAGMSEVQAVSGASGEAFEQLKEKAKEMGAKTKFSATESAEAMNYMAMAGWKTEEMLGGIEGVMNLAAASGEDLATTSDIVTDALTAFGMTAADSTHFADILAAASSNANTNVGLMGETFKYVAPLAGSLGYSAEDTATAIGLMANAGIKGSQAGTSLRSILTRLAKPTEESADAMMLLGVSMTDDEGKMYSLMEVMEQIRNGFAGGRITQEEYTDSVARWKQMLEEGSVDLRQYSLAMESLDIALNGTTEAQQAEIAAMLGGQEAMSGLLAIVNASDKDFEKLSSAINDCNGSAAEMAEIMQDNLQGQITILQSGLENLGVSLYETMQDAAKDVAKEAQEMVRELQGAFDEGGFQGLVGAFGNVLAQIVQRIAAAAPTVIEAAVSLVMSFCDGLRDAPGLGESGASLITSLVTGLMSCVGELWSTAVVLFAQLLSGLAAQLPQILETGREAVAEFGRSLVDNAPSIFSSAIVIVSALFDGLMSALPQIAGAGADVLNKLSEGIKSSLPAMIPAAMNALVEFSGSLRENAGLLVDAGLNLIMELAQSLIDNLPVFIETVPAIITNIAGIINDNAPKLLTCGIELLGKLAAGLIKAIPTLVSNIPQIIQAVVSAFTAFNWVSLGTRVIKFITSGIKSLAASIPNALKNIGQTAMDWLRLINWRTLGSDLIDLIVVGVRSLATAIPNLLRSIGHTAVGFFKSIDWLDLGVNLVKGIIAGITGALDGLWGAVTDLGTGILDGVKSFFGINSPSTVMAEQGGYLVQGLVNGIASMPAELAAYLDQTVQKTIAWGQQMFSNVQNIIQNVVNTAVNLIAQLPGKIWVWLVNTVTKVMQWGQQMLNSAKTAISNMISAVVSLMSGLPGKVWTWLVNTVTKVTAWGQQMLSSAKTAVTNMISSIVSLMSELPGKVATHLSNVVSKVVAWGSQLASKGAAAAKGLFDAVVNGVSDLPSKMAEIGSNIVSGIWNGISSGWNWLKDKVSSLANSLLDAAKDALGINSPSKAFRDEFGRWLMPGTIEGLKQSMPKALREMKAQAGELLAAMQGAVDASINEVSLNASSFWGAKALNNGGVTVYNDNRQEQENNYHVPVVTPAETAKAQREAFRKMAGGVK